MTPRRLEPDLEAVLAEVALTADTLVDQSRKLATDYGRMQETNARLQRMVAQLKEETNRA